MKDDNAKADNAKTDTTKTVMPKALTPMLRQYQEIKAQAPGAILFFRLGDFYEMFGEDAEAAAPVLGIVLTSREAGQGTRIPMCGVPYHALESHLMKMVKAGFRVAICEQTEDPAAAKGIVKREIVRIVTRGTLLEGAQSESRHAFLACVFLHKEWGLAYADLTTGTFTVFQTPFLPHLLAELSRVAPLELMLPEDLAERDGLWTDWFVTYQDKAWFKGEKEAAELLERFPGQAEMLRQNPAALRASSALWHYINICLPSCQQEHFIEITRTDAARHMLLDRWTRRNLELTETLRDSSDSDTLFGTLNFTRTAAGGRLLRYWVGSPLLASAEIEQRLDVVETFVKDSFLRDELAALLRQVYDLERLLSRLTYGKASARELLLLGRTLNLLPDVCRLLEGVSAPPAAARRLAAYREDLQHLTDLGEELCRALNPNAPVSVKEGQMILPGYAVRIDELRALSDGGKEFLARLENRERERTHIRSLKIGYNKVFGYYLEISNANKHLIPADYERKQTLVNAERYITSELKEYETKILTAQDELTALEYQIFTGLKDQTLRRAPSIIRAASALAEIDVFLALAEAAVRHGYVRPQLREDGAMEIRDGRHPVVEQMRAKALQHGFVPNDTDLSPEKHFALITGPNMAGKSTYMRQVALIALMAQMGSFVPARKASLAIVDGIFTRIGASDDVAAGQSTFLVEMSEVAYILQHATPASLLIFDEVGRGTSTYDGMSLAWAIAEHIAENPALRSKTLFATHYHQMTVLEETHPAVFNLHVAVQEQGQDIVFLHKILPGCAEGSYGLYVAKIAGIAPEILERAEALLRELEDEAYKAPGRTRPYRVDRMDFAQPSLFLTAQSHPILQELQKLNPDTLTPREAVNYLYDLVQRLQSAHTF